MFCAIPKALVRKTDATLPLPSIRLKDISAVIDCRCKEYSRTLHGVDKFENWRGYKVSCTFATNVRPYCPQLKTMSGIWFLDLLRDEDGLNLRGWLSPTGIVELLERDISAGGKIFWSQWRRAPARRAPSSE